MSKARADLDWNRMFELAIDPETARRYREESVPAYEDSCTMCGKMCSMRNMKKILQGENINVL
jgi:phosphomethylpyrimidine synthase